MITMPNRLAQARQALEDGKPVDLRQLADLQGLDLVIAGRQFVEEALKLQEAEDERIERVLRDNPVVARVAQ